MIQTATPDRTRALALGVLCAGQLMIILDQTIVNVALPSIQRDLGFSQSSLAWVVNAYLIAFGGLLLLSGRLGDLVGRKRVFLTGLTIFTFASLLCGLASDQGFLIAARFLQGIGGAATSAVILSMIVTMSPDAKSLGKAMALFSVVSAGGGALGPVAGGLLTSGISWHWIFFVNIPIGVAAGFIAVRVLTPDSGEGLGKGADYVGAALVTAGLMLGVYTIVKVTDYGWLSAHTLGFGLLAIVLVAAFVARQATAREPLAPLRIFRLRPLTGANVVQVLVVAGMFGFLFLGTLYVQRVLGFSAAKTGLAFLPIAVVIGLVSLLLAAPLMARFGPPNVLMVSIGLIAIALALLGHAPARGHYLTDVLPVMLILGAGFGAMMPALMTVAMADVPPRDSGLASGLFNTIQQVGGALTLAVLVTLATSRATHLAAAGQSTATALTGGYHVAFRIGAGCAALAVVVVALVLRSPRPVSGSPVSADMAAETPSSVTG
jgi:EmrB/QacA subfamily drug resistance transporter